METLAFITKCIQEGKVFWTYHVNLRLAQRAISRTDILSAAGTFEIIESYPEDKYMPSHLVYAVHKGIVYHVVIAVDIPGDNIRIVTTYHPSLEKWNEDLKTRRLK